MYMNLSLHNMATKKKATPKKNVEKKSRGEYETPLKVNASFMDLVNASVKDAKTGAAKKRAKKSEE
jgi:hypothetical protein